MPVLLKYVPMLLNMPVLLRSCLLGAQQAGPNILWWPLTAV